MKRLILTALPEIPLIKSGDNISEIIQVGLDCASIDLQNGDVIVIAQKIISKAENRWVNLVSVKPTPKALSLAQSVEKDPRLVELILQESREILRTRVGTIIVEHRLGFVCANAGIDHSNVAGVGDKDEEWVLLLPENPDQSANEIRKSLEKIYHIQLGILIIDSHGRAWRQGVNGVAIGLSGMPGLVDMRGEKDLFGYNLRITTIGVADELAGAASLIMGQAGEATPIVHVRGFPYAFRDGNINELLRPRDQDLFR